MEGNILTRFLEHKMNFKKLKAASFSNKCTKIIQSFSPVSKLQISFNVHDFLHILGKQHLKIILFSSYLRRNHFTPYKTSLHFSFHVLDLRYLLPSFIIYNLFFLHFLPLHSRLYSIDFLFLDCYPLLFSLD